VSYVGIETSIVQRRPFCIFPIDMKRLRNRQPTYHHQPSFSQRMYSFSSTKQKHYR